MPDGDVFTRRVGRRWRNLASALRDGLPAEECALRIEHSLAVELRKSGGFARPDLEDLLNADAVDEAQVAVRLGELVRREVFERVMPLLLAQEKFSSWEQAQRFMNLCVETARMDVVARSLLTHPDGKGLRRPGREKSSTVDLLSERASLGGHG